jgi:hypothetical protein
MVNDKEALRNNHERFHLLVFSALHPLPGDELPRKGRTQKPDFRYQYGKLITGIEHTELKWTKSAQGTPSLAELKGLHREIVKRAERLAAKQGVPPLHVEVLFHDYFYRYPNKGEKAVQSLLTSIKENLDKILKEKSGNSIEIEAPEPFVGISQIYATSGIALGKVWLTNHRWEVWEPGTVSTSFIPELQDSIDKKNKKIDDYLNACNECWLLIVADRTRADQKFSFTPPMNTHVYKSEFKKTFFLEIAERRYWELRTI